MSKVEISASVLAADFTRLGAHIQEAITAGASRAHLDVMDGRFVPNITFGPLVVEAVRRCTRAPIETHLMLIEPDRYIPEFAKAGADVLLVHREACSNLHDTLQRIHGLGKKAGVVLNPATPVASIADVLSEVEQVLIMSVNPGFGGQTFMESSTDKVAQLRAMIVERQLDCAIEIDGGIGPANAGKVVRAGAQVLVAGVSIFQAPEGVAQAIARLRQSAETA
ncbi:MAG: ribulose-phosphate 3-epimerase [Deltaproteobacteria bacterium]|nr:ribulose-phosphate 3-epimerase [Deltaproteobacteria bacterium]